MIFNLVDNAGHGHVLPQVLLHHLVGGRGLGALAQHSRGFVEEAGQSPSHVTEQRAEWEHSKGGRNQSRGLSRFARSAIVDVRETIEMSSSV